MSTPMLGVRDLARAFGGVRALDGVSFDVARGEIVALIGPNGAGKTTCLDLIGGDLRADAGSVRIDGREALGSAPSTIARLGVGRTFQVAATFASMSVRENVAVARRALARSADAASIARLLDEVGAAQLAGRHAATLAYADAKCVELALALAGEPGLLLLDEPTAGLGAPDRVRLMQSVRRSAHERRAAVLFIEHDMDIVFGFAERVIVLDRGKVIAAGAPEAIRADARVQEAYLGPPAGEAP
jgi:branched-chain amino acid transport system ATP-binding protein